MNASAILWGMVFGAIGFGFFSYGKKQGSAVPLVCGLLLMVFPYFVSDTIMLVAIGIALMIVPYLLRD